MCELSDASESEERPEPQFCSRMCVFECVAYEDSVLIVLENDLFFEDDTSDAIDGCRHFVAVKLPDVLVPFRAVVVALVFVQSEIEFCSMLHDCGVER